MRDYFIIDHNEDKKSLFDIVFDYNVEHQNIENFECQISVFVIDHKDGYFHLESFEKYTCHLRASEDYPEIQKSIEDMICAEVKDVEKNQLIQAFI